MKKLAKILAVVGILASGAASMGCYWIVFDEPTAPKSFID